MSLYCHSCAGTAARYGGAETEFKTWKDAHTNYVGPSGGMEEEAADALRQRSLEKFGFHYTTMLSDGVAKMYNRLCSLKVYGDTQIEKEECINHVAKLSTESKKNGVTLSGRGCGKLTKTTMETIQRYYGLAIRAHTGDLQAMTNAVFASFYHAISTDKNTRSMTGVLLVFLQESTGH